MISYSRDPKQDIPASSVKIVGLGGAGANMLERIALDSIEGAQLLALNTDIRTLGASLAKEKIQLGVNLTKGLGTGGDPELGTQAVLEAEKQVREALKGEKIVFLCAGLGGGTGSGAAPIVARIAREEGAFVVVFATMPFFFEGRRRREQAETSLNQLAVLSNALVTFDNNRMGELVLAKQGIHNAFGAADKMISESIKAVIRLVVRPGLINIGLDDLMTALRTTRSRCLFGSGIAEGKDRASKALRNALSSPLLDQGSLLKEAQSVLVHLSGGESLTLFEIELLMQNLQKHIPEDAQVLFGAAIDPSMEDSLSITLISALPEDALISKVPLPIAKPAEQEDHSDEIEPPQAPDQEITEPESPEQKAATIEEMFSELDPDEPMTSPIPVAESTAESVATPPVVTEDDKQELTQEAEEELELEEEPESLGNVSSTSQIEENEELPQIEEPVVTASENEDRPFAEPDLVQSEKSVAPISDIDEPQEAEAASTEVTEVTEVTEDSSKDEVEEEAEEKPEAKKEIDPKNSPELKLDSKAPGPQSELELNNTPRGRFEGENPNVFEGEDLDLPPFLRKKKR